MSTNRVENRPLSLLVHRGDSWLIVRHRRLGVSQWELPGGHLDPGEDAETAAARETQEQTGARVEIGSHVASCVHEWAQRHQRRVILFFLAHPRDAATALGTAEAEITDIAWRSPRSIPLWDISPLIHPLVAAWPGIANPGFVPLPYRGEHHVDAEGRWRPRLADGPSGR